MAVPAWIWFAFVFALGCCIGSFLNVVIYRLPRDKSLVTPPSACPSCGKHIRFYDNIPLFSWLLLGRKCRNCATPISPRYFIVELLTGTVFLAVFVLYFYTDVRPGLKPFPGGGLLVYVVHIVLLGALIAASGIDIEHWVIPLSICWLATAAGLVGSAVGPLVMDPAVIREYSLLPVASAGTGSLAVGSAIGLGISLALLATGFLKRSYSPEESVQGQAGRNANERLGESAGQREPKYNHRLESFREIVFLLPIVVCALAAYFIVAATVPFDVQRNFAADHPVFAGLLGSLWGYFVGCGVVWGIRIFGTLAFGKEAMGLGDMHLMGAAGAVIGPLMATLAFFIAPFLGLSWVAVKLFFKKIRQIPYGPSLSLGIFAVMILHDRILVYLRFMFYR